MAYKITFQTIEKRVLITNAFDGENAKQIVEQGCYLVDATELIDETTDVLLVEETED